MTSFDTRYKKLNSNQRQAVDTIDGPLLVIAGPGTGKTELLSMRAANILRNTDTLPENILCLTFTDSGANAMRERLSDIIGSDAYKVAIHTFHSFGTEVINQNNQYFYQGAEFRPADELSSYEILTGIFDELGYDNPLASKLNGEYTHLRDAMSVIGELKKSGLSADELTRILDANDLVLDSVEPELSKIFDKKIHISMLDELAPLAQQVANLPQPALPPSLTPLANVLALSMAHAFDAALETNKTTPITAWRNQWLEKNTEGVFVFKDRKRHTKLRAMVHIYFSYLSRMQSAALYDYDDMILNVVHGMELHADLRYNLQEKYQYIMVDEFQDTNLAQLRILFNLTDNPVHESRPNVMAVGDDDQAIYSFQGADVNNIHRFREQYQDIALVTLRDNYRSGAPILTHAREVITQGSDRLEHTIADLDKSLTPHNTASSSVRLCELSTASEERAWVAEQIASEIAEGTKPSDIAVLARRHNELVELLPYLHHRGILVNYERNDNVLDLPVIQALELLGSVLVELFDGHHDHADESMPELVAHPAFAFAPADIWKLSLTAYRDGKTWLEVMGTMPVFAPLHDWLLVQMARVPHEPLETLLDSLLGVPEEGTEDAYRSPFYDHYFSSQKLEESPDDYLTTLEALRTVRTKLRDYHDTQVLHLPDFLEYLRMHRQMGSSIMSVRRRGDTVAGAINLMTAHKSKGLEFPVVHVIGSVDSAWGERVRSRSRLIGYPENLPLAPAGNTYDERLRLYFVAMTRAKQQLTLSYALQDDNTKDTLSASFLVGTSLTRDEISTSYSLEHLTAQSLLEWHDTLTANPSQDMKQLLAPRLETYKLSATHLNNFIDLSRGGPASFLMNNLLQFPQAKTASASYGTAIHATLQRAHDHLVATGNRRPIEDIIGDFNAELARERLSDDEYKLYSQKGADSLLKFLSQHYDTFSATQKTELSFANQNVFVGDAHLTGKLDLIDLADKRALVTDYKTGKPSRTWKGSADYEKVKLHKYRQQLMFYQLLVGQSRDYAKYDYTGGVLQFVEPDSSGNIHALEAHYTDEELAEFRRLIQAVWRCITTLEFPDTAQFDSTYKGILEFEQYLIDNYS